MTGLYSTQRLADAVVALAGRVTEPDVRAQLHALGGILGNLDAAPVDAARREELERRLRDAMRGGDEPAAVEAMRRLAALERAPLRGVDWSAASRG
jgi:Ser/Thr protein kinase RdoA (MazF antagonist)